MRLTLPLFFPSLPPLEEPIRAELFGIERLEQHARSLAAAQTVTTGLEPKRPLLPRVEENGRVLRDASRSIADAVREERWITPAAEWLLDNFFVVDEQLREHPRRSAGRLLSRTSGARRRSPGRISPGCTASRGPLSRTPTVGSIPIPCADSCARTSRYSRSRSANSGRSRSRCAWCWSRICDGWRTRWSAGARRAARPTLWPTNCSGVSGHDARSVATVMSRADSPRLVTAFAVELAQRLRDQDPAVTPALAWLHQRLAAQGTTADEIALSGTPAAGGDDGDGAQHHHQHAIDVGA